MGTRFVFYLEVKAIGSSTSSGAPALVPVSLLVLILAHISNMRLISAFQHGVLLSSWLGSKIEKS